MTLKMSSLNPKKSKFCAGLGSAILCSFCGCVYTDACQVLHSGMTSVHAATREGIRQSSEQKIITMFSN